MERRERGGQLTRASVCGLEISENCAQAKETPATSLPRPLRCTQAQPSKYAEPQGRGLGAETLPVAHKSLRLTQRNTPLAFGSVQQPTHSSPHTAPRCSHSTARTPYTPHARTPLPTQAALQQPTSTVTRVRTRPRTHARSLPCRHPATPCVTPTFYPLQTHTHSQAHAKHAEQHTKARAAL